MRCDDRDRPVQLVAHHAPGDMLARQLTALEIERVAVAVVGRRAKHADAAVVFDPAKLAVVRNVAPDEVAPYSPPRGGLRPQRARPPSLDRRTPPAQRIARRLDRDDVPV